MRIFSITGRSRTSAIDISSPVSGRLPIRGSQLAPQVRARGLAGNDKRWHSLIKSHGPRDVARAYRENDAPTKQRASEQRERQKERERDANLAPWEIAPA